MQALSIFIAGIEEEAASTEWTKWIRRVVVDLMDDDASFSKSSYVLMRWLEKSDAIAVDVAEILVQRYSVASEGAIAIERNCLASRLNDLVERPDVKLRVIVFCMRNVTYGLAADFVSMVSDGDFDALSPDDRILLRSEIVRAGMDVPTRFK